MPHLRLVSCRFNRRAYLSGGWQNGTSSMIAFRSKRTLAISSMLLVMNLALTAHACDGPWCECKSQECQDRWAPAREAQRAWMDYQRTWGYEDAIHIAHLDMVWRIVKTCESERRCPKGARAVGGQFHTKQECRKAILAGPPSNPLNSWVIYYWPGRLVCDFGAPPVN